MDVRRGAGGMLRSRALVHHVLTRACWMWFVFALVMFGGKVLAGGAAEATLQVSPKEPRGENRTCQGDEPCSPLERVTVGYQVGTLIPGVTTRASEVLERACPLETCTLQTYLLDREEVFDAVRAGRVDVGLVGVPPPEADYVADSDHLLHLDALIVSPPSYSVVAQRNSEHQVSLANSVHPWLRLAGRLLICLAALLVLFITFTMTFNWRLPRKANATVTKLDPSLFSVANVLYWMFKSWSGRFLTAVWCVVAVGVFWLTLSWEPPPASADDGASKPTPGQTPQQRRSLRQQAQRMTMNAAKEDAERIDAVIRGASFGHFVYQRRDDRWILCDDGHECLRNLADNRATELAGNRDLLCHYQGQTGRGHLEMRPDQPFRPITQAFIFSTGGSQRWSARLRSSMSQASQWHDPWRPCE
jgi:hypothetical protein